MQKHTDLFYISDVSWTILPAVTRQDQSTPSLLQLPDDPPLLIPPGPHNGRDSVIALMAEKLPGLMHCSPNSFSILIV